MGSSAIFSRRTMWSPSRASTQAPHPNRARKRRQNAPCSRFRRRGSGAGGSSGLSRARGMDLAKVVTTTEPYEWSEGGGRPRGFGKAPARASRRRLRLRRQAHILRMLVNVAVGVTVLPAQTRAEEALALKPDGDFCQRPGGPEPATTRSVRSAKSSTPDADVRHLPRPPAHGLASGREDRENEVRASRRQPPGEGFGERRSSSPARTTASPSIRTRFRRI